MTAKNWFKGMVAGFIATVILSALMLMKARMGMMPELNPIKMMSDMLGPETSAVGWVMHFLLGTVVWGTLFAWLEPNIPGEAHWLKGIWFGIGVWLFMMIVMLPMTGAGLFEAHLGMMAPVMTLVMHIIFGVVLGGVYGLERPEPAHQLHLPR